MERSLKNEAQAINNSSNRDPQQHVLPRAVHTNKGEVMIQTTAQQNKDIVLEAFDTLFNKRDYSAAEHFWSANCIQHSAHIPPGRNGLFNLIKELPTSLKH